MINSFISLFFLWGGGGGGRGGTLIFFYRGGGGGGVQADFFFDGVWGIQFLSGVVVGLSFFSN